MTGHAILRRALVLTTLALVAALAGCAGTAAVTPPAAASSPIQARGSSLIATASTVSDLQVVGSLDAPQIILTTPVAEFDGSTVEVTFSAEYANMIPDPASALNGIGFDLYVDGVRVERMALFGSHSQVSLFGPINLADILDGTRAPTAGTHTIGIGVWKWSPNGDGYLKAGTSGGAPGMPIRLTVAYL